MLLILCLAALSFSSIEALTRQDANHYIDSVLRHRFVEEALYSKLDPIKVPDFSVHLSTTTKENSAFLTNGRLIHLSKVKRAGDCTVPYWVSANVSFTCFLKFDHHLSFNYTANVTYENIDMVFYPKVLIKNTNVTIQITSTPEENVPSLRMIFINKIGDINVKAEMIGIYNLLKIIGPPIEAALERNCITLLHRTINGRFKDALGYSIYKTPLDFGQ